MNRRWIVGHRGGGGLAAGNTLPGIRQAIEFGADAVEFDVQPLADGSLVVFHDDAVGDHALSQLTLGELHELAIVTPVEIPTLGQVLGLCSGRIHLDIELKKSGCGDGIAKALFSFRWSVDEYVVTSFSREALVEFAAIRPGARTGLLLELSDLDSAIAKMEAAHASFLAPEESTLNLHLLQEAERLQISLLPWTVNSQHRMHELLSCAIVEGLITDDVPQAIRARASVKLKGGPKR